MRLRNLFEDLHRAAKASTLNMVLSCIEKMTICSGNQWHEREGLRFSLADKMKKRSNIVPIIRSQYM